VVENGPGLVTGTPGVEALSTLAQSVDVFLLYSTSRFRFEVFICYLFITGWYGLF